MAKFQVNILEKAFDEIEKSKEYYECAQVNLGVSFTKEVFSILETIEINPYLFPIKFNNLREAAVKKFPFVVIFEILSNKEIIVLSVFHCRRNPEDKF